MLAVGSAEDDALCAHCAALPMCGECGSLYEGVHVCPGDPPADVRASCPHGTLCREADEEMAFCRCDDCGQPMEWDFARLCWKPKKGLRNMKMVEPSNSGGRQMPRYKCHKIVFALKIRSVGPLMTDGQPAADGRLWIDPEHPYHGFAVTKEWAAKHEPQSGGYYVVYDDGYASFSPAKAFEKGYTRIDGEAGATP